MGKGSAVDISFFEYLVFIRSEIIKIITGVENSTGLGWDDASPNWSTKSRLISLKSKYLLRSKKYGVEVVTRVNHCDNPEHYNIYDGFFTVDGKDFYLVYPSERHVMIYIDNEYKCFKCPCSKNNEYKRNKVQFFLIYNKENNEFLCSSLGDIFMDIQFAIDAAEDNKVRSGIREYLLRALLKINDLILPESVDSYIKKYLNKR